MRIFLSYPSELKSTAEPIAFSLRSRGHKVFLDKDDLPPGRSYDDQIQSAIEQSDILIYLICPASVEKGRYTLTEMEFARSTWRHPANRVLPVLVAPTDLSKVPAFLKGVTILEPQGNVAAEVAAAAERLRGADYAFKRAWSSAGVAVATFAALVSVFGLLYVAGIRGPGVFDDGFAAYLLGSFTLLLGVPICAVLWNLTRRPSLWLALPLLTILGALWLSSLVATTFSISERVDTAALGMPEYLDASDGIPELGDGADTTDASDTAGSEIDASSVEEVSEEKRKAWEQLKRANKLGDTVNDTAHALLIGALLMIAVLAASTRTLPELNDLKRWIVSISAGAIAAVLIRITGPAFDHSMFFLVGALACGVALAGGLLGYWSALGRATRD